MKRSVFALSIILVALIISLITLNRKSDKTDQTVNAVLGDISLELKKGTKPVAETSNEFRIVTHLEYVEELLRNKDVSNLSPELKANRDALLDLLHNYWTTGIFPRNHDFPDKRVPCFIDKDSRICAVGYLVEQTAGRAVAERINRMYQYEYLADIKDPDLNAWIASSGLTKEECAMIQPTYGPYPDHDYTESTPSYGITTLATTGLNVSLMALNGVQLGKNTNRKLAPVLGLITGAGQLTMGAINFPAEGEHASQPNRYDNNRNLSILNIGIGAGTMILSSWNLIANRKPKDKSFTWNIYALPQKQKPGIGFSLTKRL